LIDYHAQLLALDQIRKSLTALPSTDPAFVSARNQVQADLATTADYAILGTLLTHLMTHAASDGSELMLLTRAHGVWNRGIVLFNSLTSVRARLETSLANPSAGTSVPDFNSATSDAQLFARDAYSLLADVTALRKDVSALPFLPSHPRQSDKPSSAWDWANLLLGRRTDALVRSIYKLAHTTPTRAFAFGVLSGYGTNISGSTYLGQVVGGPRRSHRFRERIARNAIGTWLARAHPYTPTPTGIAEIVRFGPSASPRLPSAIERLLHDALSATFDLSKTEKLPNLQQGYTRLLSHLQLLDGFTLPAVPALPQGVWQAKIYGDPSSPPPSLRVQDTGFSGDPGGGVTYTGNLPGQSTPGKSDNSSSADICGIIAAILIIVDVVQAFVQCIVQWADKKTCTFWQNMLLSKLWEKDPPDPRDPSSSPSPTATSSQLVAMSSSDEITQFISSLYDIHTQIWEGLDRAYNFLAFNGLIYTGSLIDIPVYSQFTAIPGSVPWPHRPMDDAANWYHIYPFSSIENPQTGMSGFAQGDTPDAIFSLASDRLALHLWQQIALGEHDSQNLDLDADRGFLHPCWATGGSINTDPVNVKILAYADQ
jgi:hypothetical protein